MATRFAFRPVSDRHHPDGAWWPQSRQLSEAIRQLFALWPPEAGRIVRVLYSPPDWDDHPRSVPIPGGRVKTGCFPRDDTHQLIVSLVDGRRRAITVIPPDTPADVAAGVLHEMVGEAQPDEDMGVDEEHRVWDNEGGHP